MGQKVYLKEGLFKEKPDGGVLTGSRCKNCGRLYFPPTDVCFDCFKEEMEGVELSRRGKLFSYAVSQMAASNFKPPFAIGWVKLPEGLIVFAPIKDWEKQPLEMDMDVELVIEKLWDEGEKEVIGYKFKPVK